MDYQLARAKRSNVQVRHAEGVWRMKLASDLNGPPQGPFRGTCKTGTRAGHHDIHIHHELMPPVFTCVLPRPLELGLA